MALGENCINCELQSVVIDEVIQERTRQEKKWGQQNHEFPVYLMILGEEVGEANNAGIECRMAVHRGKPGIAFNEIEHLRTELIQVAAVAVAMVESLDRNEMKSYKEAVLQASAIKSFFAKSENKNEPVVDITGGGRCG